MRADGCDPPRSSASAIHLRWDVRLSGWMTQTARESNNPTRLPFSQSASSFNTIHFDANRRPRGVHCPCPLLAQCSGLFATQRN